MSLGELKEKITDRRAKIAVIGLGYVGLPIASLLARQGFLVTGIDLKEDRVEDINDGRCPLESQEPGLAELIAEVVSCSQLVASTSYEVLQEVDIILIDVETPVDAQHHPDYTALSNACKKLGQHLKEGALVIVESTVVPGTMHRFVQPWIESTSGKRANQGFYLGVSPERVMPGKLLENLITVNRVCGADTPEIGEVMVALYRTIVRADLDITDPVTAELVKTAENAYRDVQIAFANEIALICEQNGADAWRVRELVNKSPFRDMHLPGGGVGGPCIPKDPWLLAASVEGQVPLQLIPAARQVNDFMPGHVLDLLIRALGKYGLEIARARILILGYAYREESDDSRNSPSEILARQLEVTGTQVVIHDPWIASYRKNIMEVATDCDAVVVMVGHQAYRVLDLSGLRKIMHTPLLVDTRRVINKKAAEEAGFYYVGLGQGNLEL